MLLNHFDSSRQYVGGMKTTAVLKENKISLQLHTDSGAKPLTSDHIVDGWRLKPKEDLTVNIYLLCLCIYSFTVIYCSFMHLYRIIIGVYE